MTHRILKNEAARAAFYKRLGRVYLDPRWRGRPAPPNLGPPLREAARGLGALGLASLDLHDDTAGAQRWFGVSAGAYFAALAVTQNAFARPVWRAMARMGLCRDFDILGSFAAAYLETPDAVHGEAGTGGKSPMPNDHWWHPTRALACFFAQSDQLGAALDELLTMKPPKKWKHSNAWWSGIVELARECLANDAPEPFALLQRQAKINVLMFHQRHKEDIYERWFGELTLALACAAHAAGWSIPDEDPDPSLPLDMLRLPKRRVPVLRDLSGIPEPDAGLRAAIQRAYAATNKKPRKSTKK